MKKIIDLIGLKFERWTVIGYAGRNKHKQFMWLCLCDCGKEKIILGGSLRNGDSKSCGCLQIEILMKRSITHGYTKGGKQSRTYGVWARMIKRCKNRKWATRKT